jgi:pyruvate,water dikinase
MNSYIKTFSQIRITDVPSVGGKNASLGEMYNQLVSKGDKYPMDLRQHSKLFEPM